MKRFLAIYTGTGEAMRKWRELPEQEMRAREASGMKAWHEWVGRNKAAIVDLGGPLGKTKIASSAGIADIRNNMAAYTIVQADSHDAAVELFRGHPHFALFPGDAVEVIECLPVPGMPPAK